VWSFEVLFLSCVCVCDLFLFNPNRTPPLPFFLPPACLPRATRMEVEMQLPPLFASPPLEPTAATRSASSPASRPGSRSGPPTRPVSRGRSSLAGTPLYIAMPYVHESRDVSVYLFL